MILPADAVKLSTSHRVVNEAYAVRLQERFGIPTAFVLRALKGEPRQRAVALCRLATRYEEPNGTLLMLARRFGTGRARRQRTATTPPRRRGEVPGRPRTNTWRHGPGRYIAAPREVATEGQGGSLRDACDPEALAERLEVD
jgi:hypothetical protein